MDWNRGRQHSIGLLEAGADPTGKDFNGNSLRERASDRMPATLAWLDAHHNQNEARAQTLKRNSSTSPSCTTYSLPSDRSLPASRAPASPFQRDIIVERDRLGADEAALEISVDLACACGAFAPT